MNGITKNCAEKSINVHVWLHISFDPYQTCLFLYNMIKNLIVAVATLCSTAMLAREIPYGYEMPKEQLSAIVAMEIETFDHEVLLSEDALREHHGGRTRTGRIAFMDELDASNCGIWTTLENGDKVWMLRFRTLNAKAVNAYFNNLYLPEGSSLFIYSADLSYFEGPYTIDDCNAHGRFGTSEVFGEEAIIEYYQPADVISQATLGFYGFGHFYNHVHDYRDANRGGGSDFCEVDVNCPEGDEWTAERDAAVRLTLVDGGDQYLCSGSMVNTTALDCRPYLLTAFHCCEGISDADLLLCSVRFNYQKANCGSGSVPSNNKSGVFKHADSNDGGGESGSDFALFEVEDDIPSSWDVYYAGWDATTTTPESGVGIHHPSGDVKKISTTEDFVSSGWGSANTHWRVEWFETVTEWGVTEGGSSGSPVYNQDHRIVGQLTGGGSCCTTNGCGQGTGPTAEDYYGKMNRNWSGNPNPTNEKLKVWLDPVDQGATTNLTLDGAYENPDAVNPCAPTVGISERLKFDDVKIFPTVTSGEMTISTTQFRSINEVRIYSSAGALVEVLKLMDVQSSFDFSAYADGLYYMSFIHVSGTHLTKKFSVVQ